MSKQTADQNHQNNLTERVQQTAKVVGRLDCAARKERLTDLGLFSLEEGRICSDLTAACQYLWGGYWEDRARPFMEMHGKEGS